MTTTNDKNLENWEIHHIFLDVEKQYPCAVIRGYVGDRLVKNDLLLWFDLEEKVAMTTNEIFKIGEPNERWMAAFLASGCSLSDLEIKATNH